MLQFFLDITWIDGDYTGKDGRKNKCTIPHSRNILKEIHTASKIDQLSVILSFGVQFDIPC